MRKTMCISLSNNSTSSVSTKTSEQRCLSLFDAVCPFAAVAAGVHNAYSDAHVCIS
jgi:hypothetical protein